MRSVVIWSGVAIRVLAALALLFGPWSDEATDLSGWDVERFQAIAEAEGQPWIDHEVEYPPGSVMVIEALARNDVVGTHRVLIAASLMVDLGLAALIGRCAGRRAAAAYLVIGLPLVPAGLMRFDLWAAGLAAIAALALRAGHRDRDVGDGTDSVPVATIAVFALAVVAGAMVKIFPALLIPVAVATGRVRHAVAASILGLAAGIAWLAYAGWAGPDQVLSLRGVTGWHVESVPGSLSVLFGSGPDAGVGAARLEANAYRIGELNDAVVLAGRLLTLAVIAGLGWLAHTSHAARRSELMMLGSVAALLVTAPLLSPQFLLWLTPWAAFLVDDRRARPALISVAVAVVLTAATLGVFGPPGIDQIGPSVLLLSRSAALIVAVITAGLALRTPSGTLAGL